MRAAPQSGPDVGHEHPDVRAAAHDGHEVDVNAVPRDQVEPVHADRARLRSEHLPPAGRVVQLPAADLHGAERRRALGRFAQLRRHRPGDLVVGDGDRGLPRNGAVRVERVRLDPESEGPFVGLGKVAQEPKQPGRATQSQHEEPGGHRVERPRVTDLLHSGGPSDDRDGVVRRDALRLVDQQQPLGRRRAHAETGSPRRTCTRRSIVPAGPCSLV